MNEQDRLRAAEHRFRAASLRHQAAVADMAASMVEAGAAMRAFADSLQESFDHDVATHPDLAELNVMLDGYYAT